MGLVTTDEARSYLEIEDEEKPGDSLLGLIINGLSARIARHTRRTFEPADPDAAAARAFLYTYERGWVWIDDCRDIEAVELTATPQTSSSWEATTDFYANPLGKDVKTRIRFTAGPLLADGATAPVAVRVTAKWGHAEIPADVKLACLMWLQNIHKRDIAFLSEEIARTSAVLRMPDDVRGVLADWKRKPSVVPVPVSR